MIAAAVAAVALTRGPVAESVTPRSAIISFRTAAREHAFVVLRNGARIDAGTGVDHVARLTRLTPGTHYTYSVGADSGELAEGRFRAAPGPAPPGSPSRSLATSAAARATRRRSPR